MKININGVTHELDADPAMPILYALRDVLGLTAAKYGCGIGQCGACTVHLNGNPIRSCLTPLSAASDQEITTLEGVADGNGLHAVQQAWLDQKVAQCGYCQSGQIMSAIALLKRTPQPTEKDIEASMQGNICRCGTYPRIKKAIMQASAQLNKSSSTNKEA